MLTASVSIRLQYAPPQGLTLSFVRLCDLTSCPLWFTDLFFTTKDTKVFTKVHKGLLKQLLFQIELCPLKTLELPIVSRCPSHVSLSRPNPFIVALADPFAETVMATA